MTSSPEPSSRRLRRSGTDRQVAGVAGGVAETFGLDPSLVRIAFVVLAILGGIGLAAYAVAVFVLPDEEGAPPLTGLAKTAIVVIAVAALIAFPFAGGGAIVLAVPAAFAVLLWRLFGGKVDPRVLKVSAVIAALSGAVALGLAAGVAAAFGATTAIAISVIAAGVVLIAFGVRGGARWLIVPALALALPATVVQAADLDLKGGVGEREYRPASVSDLRPVYRLGAGELRLDLRDVRPEPGELADVTARVGAGEIRVIVPDDACVQASAETGVGTVDLLGQVNEGVDVDAERGGVAAAGQRVLRVHMEGGAADLAVRRADGRSGTGCEG